MMAPMKYSAEHPSTGQRKQRSCFTGSTETSVLMPSSDLLLLPTTQTSEPTPHPDNYRTTTCSGRHVRWPKHLLYWGVLWQLAQQTFLINIVVT